MTLLVGLCAMSLLAGCGSKEISNDKITIKQYKGLEIEKVEVAEVTDEDVELSIESDLQTLTTYTDVTDRAAQTGDQVVVDYTGKLDGVAFEGGTASDVTIVIGQAGYIDGFTEGIAGHKVGETFDVPLTFPEDYGKEELNGKDVVFTFTLDKIQQVNVPELTEEIVPQLSETAKTIEEYKAQVKADLEASNKETAQSQIEGAIWEALVDNCVVKDYPADELEEMTTNITNQYSMYAAYSGVEVEEFVQQAFGITIDEMAKTIICQQYAIELIIEEEKLELTAEEYEEGLTELATQYGYETDVAGFEEANGEDVIKEALLQEKVMDFLVDNCKQVEPKAEEK